MQNELMTLKKCMDRILKYRQEIYGLLAIWIILFHVSNRVDVPLNPGIIGPLVRMGNVCVDVFMFLSGYCICRSYERKKNLADFYKRRVLRVIIPYLIISIPLYLWKDGFETGWQFNLKGYIGDLITFNFWTRGMQTTWFVCAIILFYLIFPLLYSIAKKSDHSGIILVISVYVINIILSFVWAGYKETMIAWARLPVFILGITAYLHPDYKLSKSRQFVLIGIAVLFTVVFPIRERFQSVFGNHAEALFLSYIFLVPGLLLMMYRFVSFLPERIRHFLSFAGSVSLESYLIHVFLLRIFDFYHGIEYLNYLYYLLIPSLTLMIACLYRKVQTLLYSKSSL